MPPPAISRPQSFTIALVLVTLVMFGWTIQRGQDVNWDLQNYHLYDAYALLHGHLHADVAPGGAQSFLNPLPYLLPYMSRRVLWPIAAGLLVTTTQLAGVMLIWAIAWRTGTDLAHRGWVAVAAALAACTGAIVLTETGTSFCDLVLAAPALSGLLLVLPGAPERQQRRSLRMLVAGFFVGIAVGLKPTNAFLLPALAASAIVASPSETTLTGIVGTLGLLGAGVVLGGTLSDGAWAWLMWRHYSSPMFPFMNTIFQSPSAGLTDFSDPRYHWQGIGHALLLPLALAFGSDAASEIVVRDVRLAVALPVAAFIAAYSACRHLSPRAVSQPPDPLAALAVWLLVGSGFWLLLCPIQRYAVSLEMLAAAIILLAVARTFASHWRLPGVVVALSVLVVTTRSADFFHRPWADRYVPHLPAGVPADQVFGLLSQPQGYWATVAPRPGHAFTLESSLVDQGGHLEQRLDHIVSQAGDRLWLLDFDTEIDPTIRAAMSRHGITLASPCLRTPSMVWLDTVFCHGRLVGARSYAASDLALDKPVLFSSTGSGLIYEISGWYATGRDQTWATSKNAVLAFHTPPTSGKLVLALALNGPQGAPPHRMSAQAGDGPVAKWTLDGKKLEQHLLCVGPGRQRGDVVLVRFETSDIRSLNELHISAEPRHLAFGLQDMTLRQARPQECL
ncbi:DUF2029 domain-containing protein [Lichenicola cladoniae]|uniref:DUF2029 domain-containing protein n=1 Tax=Lichenicola cladoniae TaxID=1484109 RepID=A0A6M8HPW9_9PROT|nr:glycosyltransferase 87 family protein [Lichenicola cladoniae]NPD66427.1 DUF2029 domain-containing protein [Acetobacteraceae bacterium]QKE90337.1 DUF2029 domain-containing protein [Lichenicola cladoniae]